MPKLEFCNINPDFDIYHEIGTTNYWKWDFNCQWHAYDPKTGEVDSDNIRGIGYFEPPQYFYDSFDN